MACLALVLAGCASDPVHVRRDSGDLVPVDAALAAGVPQGTVIAAIVNQTSGGIAGWESGVSAVLVFSDGTVVRLEGLPWGMRGQTGDCSASIQQALVVANRTLMQDRAIDCSVDMVASAQMGSMRPEALAEIRAHLAALGPLTVPAWRQQNDCCDRVYTTRVLWLDDAKAVVIDEQQSGEPAPVAASADSFMAEMAALGRWVKEA